MSDNGIKRVVVTIGDKNITTLRNESLYGIYRIECGGLVYVGQSTKLYQRLSTHFDNAYHCAASNIQSDEPVDDDINALYKKIGALGLSEAKVTVYTAEDNYGLGNSIYDFLKQWAPGANVSSQRILLDAAEIMHIYGNLSNGSGKLVNTAMGGTAAGLSTLRLGMNDRAVLTFNASAKTAKVVFESDPANISKKTAVLHEAQDVILDNELWAAFCKDHPNETKGLEDTFDKFINSTDSIIMELIVRRITRELVKELKKNNNFTVDKNVSLNDTFKKNDIDEVANFINTQFIEPRLKVYKQIAQINSGDVIIQEMVPIAISEYIAKTIQNIATNAGKHLVKNYHNICLIHVKSTVRKVLQRSAHRRIVSGVASINNDELLRDATSTVQKWTAAAKNVCRQHRGEVITITRLKKYTSFKLFQNCMKKVQSILNQNPETFITKVNESSVLAINMNSVNTLYNKMRETALRNIGSIRSNWNKYYRNAINVWRSHADPSPGLISSNEKHVLIRSPFLANQLNDEEDLENLDDNVVYLSYHINQLHLFTDDDFEKPIDFLGRYY